MRRRKSQPTALTPVAGARVDVGSRWADEPCLYIVHLQDLGAPVLCPKNRQCLGVDITRESPGEPGQLASRHSRAATIRLLRGI